MTDRTPEITCPKCGRSELESRGVTVAEVPPRPSEGANARGKRLTERNYFCRECDHTFSVIEREAL